MTISTALAALAFAAGVAITTLSTYYGARAFTEWALERLDQHRTTHALPATTTTPSK